MEDATDLSGSAKLDQDQDVFRDTAIRFLGYANELGESFKNVTSKNVYRSSYGVAITYVLADAFDKARTEYQRPPKDHLQTLAGPQTDARSTLPDTQAAKSDVQTATASKSGSDALTPNPGSRKADFSAQRAGLDARTGSSDAQPVVSDGRAASDGRASVSDDAGEGDMWRASAAGLDALLWHGLATVAIPGFTINRAVWLTTRVLDNLEKQRLEKLSTGKSKPVSPRAPAALRRWAPAAVGLALIPLIVKPIDHSMDRLMDVAVRPYLGTPKHTI